MESLLSILERSKQSKAKKRTGSSGSVRAVLWKALGGALLAMTLWILSSPAWSGQLKINMMDGSSLEVAYLWEEKGEIRFEVPGGVVGVPKSQVASIEEIIAAREFDPEVLVEAPKETADSGRAGKMDQLIAANLPPVSIYEKVDQELSSELLKSQNIPLRESRSSSETFYGPLFTVEKESAELMRLRGNGIVLVMRNILSSTSDLQKFSFTLTTYDSDGQIIQKKNCEVQEIGLNRLQKKQLDMPGRIFAVTAAVKPDSRIKTYKIVATRR